MVIGSPDRTQTDTDSVGLLWTKDRSVADTQHSQKTNIRNPGGIVTQQASGNRRGHRNRRKLMCEEYVYLILIGPM